MEYFNFEEAAGAHVEEDYLNELFAQDADHIISTHVKDNQSFDTDAVENEIDLTPHLPLPASGVPDLGTYCTDVGPMYRPERACDYCRGRGLECYMASYGMMQKGCTSCIALFRNCSLIQKNDTNPDGFPGVFEEPALHGGLPLGPQVLQSAQAPTLEEGGSTSRKSGTRFSRQAIRVLKDWFAEHSHLPYPNEREKDELKKQTGLKRSQISNWLANARRRSKVRQTRGPSPAVGRSAAVDIPHAAIQDMSPLERWQHSPPENEPASMSAITKAVATSRNATEHSSRSGSHGRSYQHSSNDSSFSVFRAPSMSSLNTGRSSTSEISFASAFSHQSQASFGSMEIRGRRRRNNRAVTTVRKTDNSRRARIYQCTFCTDSFLAKYDWQRHEKSLHLALEKWICAPMGGVLETNDGGTVCVFCNAADPPPNHLETHNYDVCLEKTLPERTFYRKDHLRQHLRLVHDCKFVPAMENWKDGSMEIKSSCGFCPKKFITWQCRVDHIAAHFKTGADMSHWTGDWGFQPHVLAVIENAIPPYIIAQERATVNPFTGKQTANEAAMVPATTDDRSTWVSDANCYRRLQGMLSKYVKERLESGVVPSDKMLQDEARRIIFGDDDPWNQTSADNAQWLEIFKLEKGLIETVEPDPIQMPDLNIHPPYVVLGGLKKFGGSTGRRENTAEGRLSPPSSTSVSGNAADGDGLSGLMQQSHQNPNDGNESLCQQYKHDAGGLY